MAPPTPCDHCVDQTRIPDTIRFIAEGGMLLIACFYCRRAFSYEVVRSLDGIVLRSQKMAETANVVLDTFEKEKPKSAVKVKKKIKKRAPR